ncbi:hypothetical protein [Methylocella sp.]|uniref:hypothetical protein n=1 Tax=Methylocella sp. TaxID=1978226 RepID=UPI00378529D4
MGLSRSRRRTIVRRGASFGMAAAAALLAAATLAPSPALARHACHDDAFKFCRNVIPDRRLIQHCLERNMSHLTRACQAEFRR